MWIPGVTFLPRVNFLTRGAVECLDILGIKPYTDISNG